MYKDILPCLMKLRIRKVDFFFFFGQDRCKEINHKTQIRGEKMDRKKTIAIVDDDPNILELIKLYLVNEGYETKEYLSGKVMLNELMTITPDLIVLDIMLPDMDGYAVLTEIRKISKVPVMMVTAKGETFDKVLGLELGADDYLVKPFDGKEMTARIKAILRRYSDSTDGHDAVVVKGLAIDMSDYSLVYHGKKMDLPPKELDLLHHLVKNPNRVFTREQLLDQIWGYDYFGDTRTVDVHIKRIREKLNQDDPWEIKTVWGVGYKFQNK